ncbi:hypothetical protein Caci_5086 [Catenulispora acidiphila DSM 44928]|uniref:Lipoprotein n=1 Tax=Catenulispora acidiphila (strain DSM 44928 / JCM 14897 / NBRC 102108 / NRRL B-24433 / ID139908) TaxID=479433 RepID=C7Q4Z8_CATAD|nr:hypothetical protein [Catenulispora acidiphila]ACU73946.1 hypothetical protein Caci_5086 [Catenulispora acidiphila DSM 44928]
MSASAPHGRSLGVLCLAAVLAASLSGCRPRASADPDPAIPPTPAITAVSPSSVSDSGAVGQQDIDNLNGILSSVGGAVTSVRSAMTADSQTPKG